VYSSGGYRGSRSATSGHGSGYGDYESYGGGELEEVDDVAAYYQDRDADGDGDGGDWAGRYDHYHD
jgi:hypothetical protein